jgi:ABC-type amino acid transport system permease subunit
MFNNIGRKLKILAYINLIVWVIAGLIFGTLDDTWLLYIIGAAIGFVIGWITSSTIYAFGELVECTYYINRNVYTLTDLCEKDHKEN